LNRGYCRKHYTVKGWTLETEQQLGENFGGGENVYVLYPVS